MIVPALTDEQRKRKRAAQNDALGMDTPHGIHALEPNAQRLRHSPDATYPERSPPLGDLAGHPDPSFVLPVHTDELGRLPIWPNLEFTSAPPTGNFANFWPSLGEDETFADYDPEFENVFANLFPDVESGHPAGPFDGRRIVGGQPQSGLYPPLYGPMNAPAADPFPATSYPAPPISHPIPSSTMFSIPRY